MSTPAKTPQKSMPVSAKKLLYIVNVDWFFLSHRLAIAKAAVDRGLEVHIATVITGSRDSLESHGFHVHPIEINRSYTGIVDILGAFRQVYSVIKAVKPDLMHLVTIKPVLLGCIATRLVNGPAVVAAVSGLGYVFVAKDRFAAIRRVFVGTLYRFAFGLRNLCVIFQNRDDLEALRRMTSISMDQCKLIRGSGVDFDLFRFRPLPTGVPLIVLPSRMLWDKGVGEFVDAARELRKRGVGARFALVGRHDESNPSNISIEQLERWEAEGVVEWWRERDDMPCVLTASTLVVLPSYREGMPRALLEALAVGRPIVTTNVPGCRELVDAGRTGLLVPARDSTALADAIGNLLDDPDLCRAMAKAARKFAEREFGIQRVVEQHLQIYEDLLTVGGRE